MRVLLHSIHADEIHKTCPSPSKIMGYAASHVTDVWQQIGTLCGTETLYHIIRERAPMQPCRFYVVSEDTVWVMVEGPKYIETQARTLELAAHIVINDLIAANGDV